MIYINATNKTSYLGNHKRRTVRTVYLSKRNLSWRVYSIQSWGVYPIQSWWGIPQSLVRGYPIQSSTWEMHHPVLANGVPQPVTATRVQSDSLAGTLDQSLGYSPWKGHGTSGSILGQRWGTHQPSLDAGGKYGIGGSKVPKRRPSLLHFMHFFGKKLVK